jgi:hypothetical protein
VPEISADSLVTRRSRPLTNDLSDRETVMLDIERGTYFGLQDVGKAIWEALETPTRVDDICSLLMERFEVDEETCRREVSRFMEQLIEHDLIEVRDAGTTA